MAVMHLESVHFLSFDLYFPAFPDFCILVRIHITSHQQLLLANQLANP